MQRLEEVEQAKVVKWSHKRAVRELMPALSRLFHVPNGGNRSAFTGAQMTALGVVKGVLDLLMPAPVDSGYGGLAIEMKVGKGRLTSEQQDWLDYFNSIGWCANVCYSAEEARTAICEYFGINPDTAPALDA